MKRYGRKNSTFGFPRLALALFSLSFLVVGCGSMSSGAPPSKSGQGVLHGTVSASPAVPVETVNDRSSTKPLPHQQVRIEAMSGTVVMTTITDEQGQFSALLSPGHYRVQVQNVRYPMRQRESQITVTIVAGQTSEVNIVLDSGIR